jgi:hypothetical protein
MASLVVLSALDDGLVLYKNVSQYQGPGNVYLNFLHFYKETKYVMIWPGWAMNRSAGSCSIFNVLAIIYCDTCKGNQPYPKWKLGILLCLRLLCETKHIIIWQVA